MKKYIVNTRLMEQILAEGLSLGGYPAGAADDPTAPYNQSEPEMIRQVDLKPEEINFELLVTDDKEFAILKNKDNNKNYILYFDKSDDEFKQFMAVPKGLVGKDDEGDDYDVDYESAIIDDKTIESYASYQNFTGHAGTGLAAYEAGLMAEIDDELKNELITMFNGFKKYGNKVNYDNFVSVLQKN